MTARTHMMPREVPQSMVINAAGMQVETTVSNSVLRITGSWLGSSIGFGVMSSAIATNPYGALRCNCLVISDCILPLLTVFLETSVEGLSWIGSLRTVPVVLRHCLDSIASCASFRQKPPSNISQTSLGLLRSIDGHNCLRHIFGRHAGADAAQNRRRHDGHRVSLSHPVPVCRLHAAGLPGGSAQNLRCASRSG